MRLWGGCTQEALVRGLEGFVKHRSFWSLGCIWTNLFTSPKKGRVVSPIEMALSFGVRRGEGDCKLYGGANFLSLSPSHALYKCTQLTSIYIQLSRSLINILDWIQLCGQVDIYSACLQGFWQERQSWNHVMPFPLNPSYLQACGTGLTVTPSPQVTQQFDTVRTYQVSIHLAPDSHQVTGSSDIFSWT